MLHWNVSLAIMLSTPFSPASSWHVYQCSSSFCPLNLERRCHLASRCCCPTQCFYWWLQTSHQKVVARSLCFVSMIPICLLKTFTDREIYTTNLGLIIPLLGLVVLIIYVQVACSFKHRNISLRLKCSSNFIFSVVHHVWNVLVRPVNTEHVFPHAFVLPFWW